MNGSNIRELFNVDPVNLSVAIWVGFLALFAGGCVRDRLMGREAKDYDVATDALPEEVESPPEEPFVGA